MYRLRNYDKLIHPDHFKGSGFRGTVIVALNWLRWKLEVFVQRLAVKWFAKADFMTPAETKEVMSTFDLDVRAEALEKDRTSPLRPQPEVPGEPPTLRSDRYEAGGYSSAMSEEGPPTEPGALPLRPQTLDSLAARYGTNTRAKRYSRGLKFQAGLPDGDFEPLEEDRGHRIADSGISAELGERSGGRHGGLLALGSAASARQGRSEGR